MTHFAGRKSAHPRQLFRDLSAGDSMHGLSDGSWSFLEAVIVVASVCGPSDVTISTWTAANADIRHASALLSERAFKSLTFLIDRSFLTRQPTYCKLLRHIFGDGAIRVVNSHAKFAVFTGGDVEALYLTSANLNRNRRIENFSLFVGGSLPGQYRSLVADAFDLQAPAEGFALASTVRQQTERLMSSTRR